jgi:cell division protein FtsQ
VTARPRGWRGWLRAAVRPRGLLVVAALIAVLAAGYMLWLRDLPIFAVKDVTVEGASGPEAAAIAEALDEAAREMTTLHVDEDALRAAAERFPTFVGLRTDASFPTGLRITVKERPPVLLVRGKDGVAPVAGDGTVLAGVKTDAKLPAISLEERLPAGGDKLRDEGLALALVLGAAPEPLAELVRDVSYGEEYGVEIELKGGIPLRFGGPERAGDKWAAAAAVLAEPEVTSLTYLDLRVPERPAIGGASAGDSAATEEAPSQ